VEELASGSGNSGNSAYALAHALKSRMKSVGQIGGRAAQPRRYVPCPSPAGAAGAPSAGFP
jgi:hypothetical protein